MVRALANHGRRCLVLVDQVDVLVDLAGAHPARLAVLFDFMQSIAGWENVHLVLSCRTTEFELNNQLRRLDAERIQLRPFMSEQVERLLRAHTQLELSEPVLATLRTPQFLRLVVDHAEALAGRLSAGSDVLDVVMSTLLSTRAVQSAMALAIQMGECEQMWLTKAALEPHCEPDVLADLCESRLADFQDDRFQFAHQIVFEYFWALHAEQVGFEVLLRGPQTTYVRARVRNALRRLRVRDIENYVTRIDELWSSELLRKHLRFLLLDVAAESEVPSSVEANWFLARIDETSWRRFALSRLGTVGWFDALESKITTNLGRWGDEGKAIGRLLKAAAAERSLTIAKLLRRYWLEPEFIRSAQWAAERLDLRLPESRALWREIAASRECHYYPLIGFFDRQAVDAEFAADLLGVFVASAIDHSLGCVTIEERTTELARALEINWPEKARAPVEAAPLAFLDRVWSPLQRAIEQTRNYPQRWGGYPHSAAAPLEWHRPFAHTFHLVEVALLSFVRLDPRGFGRFLATRTPSRSNSIHRIISLALIDAPKDVILDYLEVEQPRLVVESQDRPYPSRRLIEAIASQLLDTELECLTSRIFSLAAYPDPPEFDPGAAGAKRYLDAALQVGLLSALPYDRLPLAAQARFDHLTQGLNTRWDLEKPRPVVVHVPARTVGIGEMSVTQVRDRIIAAVDRPESVWNENGEALAPNLSGVAWELAAWLGEAPERAAEIFATLEPAQLEQVMSTTVEIRRNLTASRDPSELPAESKLPETW